MSLPKLADYRNDLFATRATVTEALAYANEVCSTLPDANSSIAVRTAFHVILNTAIATHKDEIAAIVQRGAELAAQRNDPLTEQIKAIVREVTRHELAEKMPDMMTECIEEWAGDNLDSKMDDWAEQNIDLADAVETHMNNEVDWDEIVGDKVNDKIRSYFRNNSFTIEEN
jgi:hypothetical protein